MPESPFKYLAPFTIPRPVFLPKRVGESPIGEAQRRRRAIFYGAVAVIALAIIVLAALFWSMNRYRRGGGSRIGVSAGEPTVYLNGVERMPKSLAYYKTLPTPAVTPEAETWGDCPDFTCDEKAGR